jgi:hypothetical protein
MSKENGLRDRAKEYFIQGLNVIPVSGKQPIIQWIKWQNQKQTETDFETLPWEQADGYALIGGSQLKNGFFIGAIDFDVKNTSLEAQQKAKEIVKCLPITQIEETPSAGQHWIYLSHKKPKTISIYHKNSALELLGENKLIIMAPSKGYKRLNDNKPIEIDDLESIFHDALCKAEKKHSKEIDVWFDREDLARTPYSGPIPRCIERLLQGVEEGERNETAIRLASYFMNFRKLPKNKSWEKLKEWNSRNNTPLDTNELRIVFDSAIKGKYNYGCRDFLLNKYCTGKDCPLAKEVVQIPREVLEKEVEKILASEKPVLEIGKHLDNIIAGEKENKLTIFILLLSGKFREPSMKQMILLKGSEGSGKSTLMGIADFFDTKDVGRFSEHALDYTNLTGYEILRLKELGCMDEEKQGISTVKFLSNDDKGYKVEVTVKDKETGHFTTEEHVIPPITIISSTVRVLLDPQYIRRNWIINPDESPEQTEKVMEWKANHEKELTEVALGIKQYTTLDYSKQVLNYLVKKLDPCTVIVPFPKTLIQLLNLKVLRARGDYDKIVAFVKLYGFLNQNRLPKKEINGKRIRFATPEICIEALKIVEQPLISMTLNLERRTQKLVEILEKEGITETADEIDKTKRDKIAICMGKSERTVRAYLSEWEAIGYLSSDDKKPKTFKMLCDLDEIKEKMIGISAKLESADSLIVEMQKEAQESLNSVLENGNQWIGEKTQPTLQSPKIENITIIQN